MKKRKSRQQKFIIFGTPDIQKPEIGEVVDSLSNRWLGTGPKVARFERDFGAYKGVPHIAAVNSCTAALHLSMLALKLKRGDEVITSALTFCATVNAIIHANLQPVLADIDSRTMNIDPIDIERRITPRTRAILPVHFAGRPCNMDWIMSIAKKNQLKVIEDCAHAIETEYMGRKSGTFGDFGCFSFYVTKNIATGEGGMVIARRERDIARIKIMALHGMSKNAWKRFNDKGYKHYDVIEAGFKYNMMDLQAALGIHQLARVENNWIKRQSIWQRYQKEFLDLPLRRPPDPETGTRHAYHLYTILINKKCTGISRDEFIRRMTINNIGVGVHYRSIPEHPFYQKRFGWRPSDYPNATRIGQQTVSLPLSPAISNEEIDRIICATHDTLGDKD